MRVHVVGTGLIGTSLGLALRHHGDEVTLDIIRDGDEETRHLMRVLHEEVVERIKLLGGRP